MENIPLKFWFNTDVKLALPFLVTICHKCDLLNSYRSYTYDEINQEYINWKHEKKCKCYNKN